MKFDQEKWDKVKQIEFLRKGGPQWIIDFTKDFDSFIRKALLYEEYDKVWKLIKEKNNW